MFFLRDETGSGGMVLESSQISLGWDDIDKIINAESPVIRFEGKEEKNLDHTLTENEINALRSLSIIAQARIELSEMRSAWEQDF